MFPNTHKSVSSSSAAEKANGALSEQEQQNQTQATSTSTRYNRRKLLGPTGLGMAAAGATLLLQHESQPAYAASTSVYFNVADPAYAGGAKGDGSTDDTAAIQAAINAAANNSTDGSNVTGGTVFFPWTQNNTYLVSGLTLYNNVHLLGCGPTVLKLANNANTDVVQGYNAPSLIGGNSSGGIYGWGISNLIIDGNKSYQTAPSYGLRVYGYGYYLQNVRIRNTYSDAFYSDWNGGANSPGNDSMEASIIGCKFHDTGTGAIGVNFHGPHDSQFVNCISYKTGSHAFYLGPNAGGTQFTQCHGWGMALGVNAVAWLIESLGVFVNCQAEGSDGMQVVMLANSCIWSDGRIFSGGVASNNTSGLQIGQPTGVTPYPGSAYQSSGVTTGRGVSNYFVDSTFSGCEGPNGAIWFANDSGKGFIRGPVVLNDGDGNTNNVATGPINASTQVWLIPAGTLPTADGTLAKGGRIKVAANANNGFTVGDMTQDIFNVNTYFKRVDYPNGTYLRGYSDNYGTTAFQLDSTLSTTQSSSAAAIATGGTATTSDVGVCRLSPTAAVTGCILQAGTRAGQQIWVINEAASANSVSWATQATSHIAGEAGGTFILAGGRAQMFVWNSSRSLWFKAS